MTKRSTAVNQAWKTEAVAIATGKTGETLYYVPSKRELLVTDGAGVIGLTIADAQKMIERDGMTQHAPIPTWEEMTERYTAIRRARRDALKGE